MEPCRDQEEDGQTHPPTLHLHQKTINVAAVNQIDPLIELQTNGMRRLAAHK